MAEVLEPIPPDQRASIVKLVQHVRRGIARTRPELIKASGYGRSIVTQRVEQAIDLGLLREGELGPSTGGRAPRELEFRSEIGSIYVAVFGAQHVAVAMADLDGRIKVRRKEEWAIEEGPTKTLAHVVDLFDEMRAEVDGVGEPWAVVIGVPGPVEFSSGRPVAPPIMPGWDEFDIRGWFHERMGVPTWVDNDVNLMALGEWTSTYGPPDSNLLYLKVGSGIGAGIISEGRPHRGANGSAGDIGHVATREAGEVLCRCGQRGCLEAVAGGWALSRDATARAAAGESEVLARIVEVQGELRPADVTNAAKIGDPVSVELVGRSARIVGEVLASLVNFFNPSVVIVGGSVPRSSDTYMAAVRETVYSRSLPLATRNLRMLRATPERADGVEGAIALGREAIFSSLESWIEFRSPVTQGEAIYRAPIGVFDAVGV